jgi:hypothetical protein
MQLVVLPNIFLPARYALVAVGGDAIDQIQVGLHHRRLLCGIVHIFVGEKAIEVNLYVTAHDGNPYASLRG